AEPVALRVGVVLEQGPLAVEGAERVLNAALDGLGDAAAVAGCPVAEELPRLVGALKDGGDDLPRVSGLLGRETGLGELGSTDDRRGPHVRLGAEPAEQAGSPVRVFDGELPDEGRVPVVAVAARLVEG